jgi:hypothetical protein
VIHPNGIKIGLSYEAAEAIAPERMASDLIAGR